MRHPYRIPAWKTAPFIRLLFPLGIGIVVQWYFSFALHFIILSATCFSCAFFLLNYFQISKKYKLRALQGILLQLMLCNAGLFITWQKDIRHHAKWFGHIYSDTVHLIVRIDEPLVQKERSNKADGYIEAIVAGDKAIPVHGKILMYFPKDPASSPLHYGDKILIKKPLQQIQNTGNPGAFNYRRYAAFQQIFHNVYLGKNDFVVLHEKNVQAFRQFIYAARKYIVAVLQQYISKDKNTIGIAEALLIGYKEDLDKDLVQAYSNTGVVHIIAISGLHLGLIYFMLSWLLNRVPFLKKNTLLKVILILGSLWLFAILTGSSASVLRSAVMFSCILLGSTYFKHSSIYNALASSAFILLCYNPYFLWDVGFQLSYLAVIGIVWLQQPIYHLVYIKNKWLNKIWNMVAITVAAQLAAFPLCIYYFHQFPNLFLVTNLVAVPLSTAILFAEIFLLSFSWIKFVAVCAGKIISILIGLMNYVISICNDLPWSVLDKIYASVLTTWLLYGIVIYSCGWLLYRNKILFRLSMIYLLFFAFLQAYAKAKCSRQQKVIVYNIPRTQAIDIISRDKYYFIGDSSARNAGQQQNFHLKPARIALQVDESQSMPKALAKRGDLWLFAGLRLMVIERAVSYQPVPTRIPVDILVISKNPSLKISGIVSALKPSIIVFDSSNSLWKIAEWKRECSALLLRFHSVPEQGAFVFDIK